MLADADQIVESWEAVLLIDVGLELYLVFVTTVGARAHVLEVDLDDLLLETVLAEVISHFVNERLDALHVDSEVDLLARLLNEVRQLQAPIGDHVMLQLQIGDGLDESLTSLALLVPLVDQECL